MKTVMAGCVIEFVSGVKQVSEGVYEMDGNPIQLRLSRETKTGTHWLNGSSKTPTLRVMWFERRDCNQASNLSHGKTFGASNGDWTWTSDLGATAELNTLFGTQVKDRYFGGYFMLVAEFEFKYGDAQAMMPVSALLMAPKKG